MTSKEKQQIRYKKWYENHGDEIRERKRKIMARLRKENPRHYREQSRQSKKKLKDKVFEKYGNICVNCGFTDIRALTLDHVLNNGAEERKTLSDRSVYRRSLTDEATQEYQILCMNCQFIKRVESCRQNQHK